MINFKKSLGIFLFLGMTSLALGGALNKLDAVAHLGAEKDNDLTVKKMIEYAIEDEYLAKTEYELIITKLSNSRPFTNIVESEKQHISMLEPLVAKYKVVPMSEVEVSKLTAVPKDLKSAFETGVEAEIKNIAMYEKFLAQKNLPDDVKQIFQYLLNASKNHLGAFQRNLKKY